MENPRDVDQGDSEDVPIREVKRGLSGRQMIQSMVECRQRAVDTLLDLAERHPRLDGGGSGSWLV